MARATRRSGQYRQHDFFATSSPGVTAATFHCISYDRILRWRNIMMMISLFRRRWCYRQFRIFIYTGAVSRCMIYLIITFWYCRLYVAHFIFRQTYLHWLSASSHATVNDYSWRSRLTDLMATTHLKLIYFISYYANLSDVTPEQHTPVASLITAGLDTSIAIHSYAITTLMYLLLSRHISLISLRLQ
jgi:hypothetical protein